MDGPNMKLFGNANTADEDIKALEWILKEYRDSLMLKPETCVGMMCLDDLEELTQDPVLKEWAALMQKNLMEVGHTMQQLLDLLFDDTRRHLGERAKARTKIEQMRTNANLVKATYPRKVPT